MKASGNDVYAAYLSYLVIKLIYT